MSAPVLIRALVVVGTAVQTAVGSAAAWKQPRNLVGWCLLSPAAANALKGFVGGYAELPLGSSVSFSSSRQRTQVPGGGDWIRVAVHDSPDAALGSEDARGPQSHR
jgi:hypothetical protein